MPGRRIDPAVFGRLNQTRDATDAGRCRRHRSKLTDPVRAMLIEAFRDAPPLWVLTALRPREGGNRAERYGGVTGRGDRSRIRPGADAFACRTIHAPGGAFLCKGRAVPGELLATQTFRRGPPRQTGGQPGESPRLTWSPGYRGAEASATAAPPFSAQSGPVRSSYIVAWHPKLGNRCDGNHAPFDDVMLVPAASHPAEYRY